MEAYVPLATRARWFMGCLIVDFSLLGLVWTAGFIFAAIKFSTHPPSATWTLLYAAMTSLVARVHMLLVLASWVTFCLWIHQAYRNLIALRVTWLDYSPDWAVGAWFVPVLNLVRPYQIMRELWLASTTEVDRSNWLTVPLPPMLRWWWGLWISGSLITVFRARISSVPWVISSLGMLGQTLVIVSGVLVMLLMHQITQRQAEKQQNWEAGYLRTQPD